MSDQYEIAKTSLERILEYDTSILSREEELGKRLSFSGAIDPANRLIALFKQLPLSPLDQLSDTELRALQHEADSSFNLLEEVKKFDPENPENNTSKRDNIINKISDKRQQTFTTIYPIISYLSARATDFSALESNARAAVQAVEDEARQIQDSLRETEGNAERILENVKRVAEEQGVSQQAVYYKNEADYHATEAENWRKWTILTAIGLGVFAVLSVFIHKIPFLTPENTYEAIQLSISKILIFAVISYMLILCARNFLSHMHNKIVNKHRQNALVTFKALADAARENENQEIVLTHAAECIFSPQETGYTKASSSNMSQPTIQTVFRSLGQGAKETSG